MLEFRTQRRFTGKTNYLGHTFQRKVLWGGMVIAVLMIVASRVNFRLPGIDRLNKPERPAAGPVEDNRVAPPAAKTEPDAVVAKGDKPQQPVERKRLFADVSPTLFTILEDDAVYRAEENDSFFTLLKVLADADERDVRLASTGTRTFRQLQDQSDDYRGEIVTVKGKVARLIPQPKPLENKQGITKYYSVWLEPAGNRLPIFAICTELPADYPTGGDSEIDVEISGFFYKRLGYASAELSPPDPLTGERQNVFRSSPLVLAKTLSWRLRPSLAAPLTGAAEPAAAEGPSPLPFGIPQKYTFHVIVAGVALMIMLSIYSYRLSRTSVVARGPIVGRARRAAEEAEPTNLNSLKIEP